jgi:hypothetical protein
METDPKFKDLKSNLCVIHSRFVEVRRYYSEADVKCVGETIPLDHAHPNIDVDNKIAVFHNGYISNLDELKLEM